MKAMGLLEDTQCLFWVREVLTKGFSNKNKCQKKKKKDGMLCLPVCGCVRFTGTGAPTRSQGWNTCSEGYMLPRYWGELDESLVVDSVTWNCLPHFPATSQGECCL